MVLETVSIMALCKVLQKILRCRSPEPTRCVEIAVDCQEVVQSLILASALLYLLMMLRCNAAEGPLPKRLQVLFRPRETMSKAHQQSDLFPEVIHT
jgi:hypothetical protein